MITKEQMDVLNGIKQALDKIVIALQDDVKTPLGTRELPLGDKPKETKSVEDYTHDSLMPFGKHKGVKLRDIPETYAAWLMNQPTPIEHPQLAKYADKYWSDLERD